MLLGRLNTSGADGVGGHDDVGVGGHDDETKTHLYQPISPPD